MEINIKLFNEFDYMTTEWSGGKTTQLFIYPEDSNYKELNFNFRLSSATVELEKSEFTKLEGIYRFITPLDKELKLTHNHKDYIKLMPFEIYEFDGGICTTSYGTARDFNLMLGNGAKGVLESIYINKECSVRKEYFSESRETIYFIYTYDGRADINIGGDIKTINPLEALLIKLNGNGVVNLNIKSNIPTNILLAKINMQ